MCIYVYICIYIFAMRHIEALAAAYTNEFKAAVQVHPA